MMALCFLVVFANGRQKSEDSIRLRLKDSSLSQDNRIELLLSLAWENMMNSKDSVRNILDRAFLLASSDSNFARMGDTYAYRGTSYYYLDQYDSALYFYRKADLYYKKDTSDKAAENIAANQMSIGTAYLQQGDHQVAIRAYLQAIRILEQAGDYNNLVTAYANTGLVYNDLKQYDKALSYHLKALNIGKKYPADVHEESIVQVLMFITLDYLNLKQYKKAETYLYLAGNRIKELKSDYLYTVYYGYKGRYFYETKDYTHSIENLNKAVTYSQKTGQQFQKAHALLLLGLTFFEKGNDNKSINYLEEALGIFRKIGDKIRENKTLFYLSRAYANKKNYALSVEYYQAYTHLNDSLNIAESKRQINEIENKYQTQRKADSILVLQKNNQIQRLSLYKKRNLNYWLISGLALLTIISILVYRNLKHRHFILKQNEIVQQQRIQELEKERQLVAAQSILEGQEQERSRLAKDLHDGVGGLLSGVKLSLSTMKGNVFLSEESAQAVGTVIQQLDQSIAELRRVSHNMMPEALINFGLKEALENYCENLNLSGEIKVQLQAYGMEERMKQEKEIILYRIVQELLNNILKHAGARNVLIQLIREEDCFTLTVEDDGKGFNIQEAEKKGGAGIANVKARVVYLEGTVDFQSVPGEGTSVNITGSVT